MNGAESLLETLVASGVEVCFTNPGTSEIQLVSAIGNHEKMRAPDEFSIYLENKPAVSAEGD